MIGFYPKLCKLLIKRFLDRYKIRTSNYRLSFGTAAIFSVNVFGLIELFVNPVTTFSGYSFLFALITIFLLGLYLMKSKTELNLETIDLNFWRMVLITHLVLTVILHIYVNKVFIDGLK